MRIFLEPTQPKQWNLFEKVQNIGHIEPFIAHSKMRVGDFVLLYVGGDINGKEKGIYAVGVVIKSPYILKNSPEDYCNNKSTVDICIFKLSHDKPIITFEQCKNFTGNYRTRNLIDESHYGEIISYINN